MTIYEVVLEGRQGPEEMLTVLHYDVTGGDPPDFQAMSDFFRAELVENLASVCPPNTSWVGITVRLDAPGNIGNFYGFTAGTLTGTNADTDVITQASMLVKKNTNTLTRPNKGRIYQGGLSVAFAGGAGLWETAIRDAVLNFWSAMRDFTFAGGESALMVVKASNPTAPNTVPYNPVASIVTSGIPVVQRRRKINAGV